MKKAVTKIALCGHIRSGKDTVGDYLVRTHGFTRFAFGDGIRRVVNELFPEEVAKGKPRALLQGVGQQLRQVDPEVWVKWVFREIEKSGANRVVITDLRQPNEYKALLEDGFYIVRVNATDEDRLQRSNALGDKFTLSDMTHETESHMDGFGVHFEIWNDGSLEDLFLQAEDVFDAARRGY